VVGSLTVTDAGKLVISFFGQTEWLRTWDAWANG